MSSDSFSDMSDLDVVEGSVANVVQESQLDPSIQQSVLQVSPRVLETRTQTQTPNARSRKHYPRGSMQKIRDLLNSPDKPSYVRPPSPQKYTLPKIKSLDPETFNYSLSVTPKDSLVRIDSPLNYVEENKKLIRDMPRKIRSSFTTGNIPSKPRALPDVEQRFYQYRKSADHKVELKRKESIEEETSGCTFRPTVNKSEKTRTHKEVYHDLMRFHKHRENRLKESRELNKKEEKFKFKPSISEKSKRIFQGKPYAAEQCHERLYQTFRSSLIKERTLTFSNEEFSVSLESMSNNTTTFTPKLNRESRELVREGSIEDRLYADALRRQKKETTKDEQYLLSPSTKSIKILVKGFLKEFKEMENELDVEKTGKINYTRFVGFFREMHFLKHPTKKRSEEIVNLLDLWNLIGGDSGKVQLKDVKVLMMGIMGYYQPWMEDPKSQGFILSKRAVYSIHDKYMTLFKNRGAFEKIEKVEKQPSPPHSLEPSERDHKRIEDSLIEQGKLREQRLNELREKHEADVMNECTFKPTRSRGSIILEQYFANKLVESRRSTTGNLFNTLFNAIRDTSAKSPVNKVKKRLRRDSVDNFSPIRLDGSYSFSEACEDYRSVSFHHPETEPIIEKDSGNENSHISEQSSISKRSSNHEIHSLNDSRSKNSNGNHTSKNESSQNSYNPNSSQEKSEGSKKEDSEDEKIQVSALSEESFIISVNIGGSNQPTELRVKSSDTAEGDIDEFARKFNLTKPEHSKLKKHVLDIVRVNS